jgi:hypothetical protein
LHVLSSLPSCPGHELQIAYVVRLPELLNETDACQPVAAFDVLPPVGKLLMAWFTVPVVLKPPPTAFGRGLAQFTVAVTVAPEAPVAVAEISTVERADPVAP